MSDKLEYEVIVTDKDGQVIQREKRPARSYLKAYNQMVLMRLSVVNQTVTDTGGAARSINTGFYTFWVKATAGVTAQGTRVGSGDTAVDISDYALETEIAHGTGDGQLSHLAEVIISPTVGASESAFTVKRSFVNGSGGNVTVREIGVYCRARAGGSIYYFCIVRDVLGGDFTVPNGGAITVIYSFKAVE
ncbi:hypothetical protein ES703_47509 [subsurface metagenome]